MQSIETHYAGKKFRSRLEARWWVFFQHLGLSRYMEYEPQGYKLPALKTVYLPDFRLTIPALRTPNWYEIKPTLDAQGIAKFWEFRRLLKLHNEAHAGDPDWRDQLAFGYLLVDDPLAMFSKDFRSGSWPVLCPVCYGVIDRRDIYMRNCEVVIGCSICAFVHELETGASWASKRKPLPGEKADLPFAQFDVAVLAATAYRTGVGVSRYQGGSAYPVIRSPSWYAFLTKVESAACEARYVTFY